MHTDWYVVGAGFTGATFARQMADAGQRVVVLDARSHIGGNAYDECNEHGLLIHKYGPHIFHTNSQLVWDFLSRFTRWRTYEHRVLGELREQLVPIPFNFTSLEALFFDQKAKTIRQALRSNYGDNKKVPILTLRAAADPLLREFADFVYANVFEGYTIKQWGLRPEDLSASVTGRVPVLVGYDDRYFQDDFQAMPLNGYRELFRNLLDHPKISVELDCHWRGTVETGARVFFTGALDELMAYRYGPLPYRSLRFEETTLKQEWFQRVGTVNYPNRYEYTRITEQKHITGQQALVTTLIKEFPVPHTIGETIPYYPIPQTPNQQLHQKYLDAAKGEYPNYVFAGRLADYQYYNMDQACARGLMLAGRILSKADATT